MEETVMESVHDERVLAYRDTLLSALRARSVRQDREQPEVFQVFVNQESIGILDGRRDDTSRISVSRERAVHTVEIRSETGELVGGVCMQEFDRKAVQLRIGRSMLDINVQNRPDGGTVRVTLQAASPAWARIPAGLAAAVARWGSSRTASPSYAQSTMLWSRAGTLAQIALAGAVLFLVVERAIDDAPGMKATTTEEVLARQERLLVALMHIQAEVKQTLEAQLRDAAADRAQLRGQVRSMTTANEALSREMAQLQTRAIVTEAKLANQEHSFKFWVSFQDGTSQERIDQWVKEIRGRTGPTNAGWYPVEVNLSKPQTSDELLESLKKAKIVKAITTSLNTAPAPK
jgi:hypothetical protein